MSPDAEQLARTAIHHSLSIYNNAGDRGRIEELLTTFTEDGVLEVPGGTISGSAAIRAFLSDIASGRTITDLAGSRHHLTTSRIEFDGDDAARGWTYFFVMRNGSVIQEGTYVDRFQRAGARWLIAHRRVKILYERKA